jgi:orotidine-5'-phosphate decarboxylase
MGMDSIEPWISSAENKGKGAFVLMRTSNKGRADFQCRTLDSGATLYDAVGDRLQTLASTHTGVYGYGAFGAVVGCTERDEAVTIRAKRKNLFFLIPGYGAQGGAAEDAAILLREGNGGVVNASRSILKAWAANPECTGLTQAVEAARQAALEMRNALLCAIKHSV